MSQGILIFAFNNQTFDYVKQALWAADRANRFLDKPVTIITNKESLSSRETKHNIVFAEPGRYSRRTFRRDSTMPSDKWFNGNRFLAYDLSPYNETIVIDSDYVICSDRLNLLFGQSADFLTHRFVSDLGFKGSFDAFNTFGQTAVPHYWATILYFRKSEFASDVFDLIEMIQNHYKYYGDLYKFITSPYRNDHAVSIAQLIANGHNPDVIPSIPWNLPTLPTDVAVNQINDVTFDIFYEKWAGSKVIPTRNRISGIDFHCMDKFILEEIIDANS